MDMARRDGPARTRSPKRARAGRMVVVVVVVETDLSIQPVDEVDKVEADSHSKPKNQ